MSALIAVMAALVAIACAGCWLSAERDRRALSAELTTRTGEAAGYRAEVMRLSARNTTGGDQPPASIEDFTAWLGSLPTAEEQEYRRD